MTIKAKIWQVAEDVEGMFASYKQATKDGKEIVKNNYEEVWTGEKEAKDARYLLDQLFEETNIGGLDWFRGRSMSVSDVVEIINEDGSADAYYCDTFGWQQLEAFEFAQEPLDAPSHRAVVVEPWRPAKEAYIEDGLRPLQRAVGGWIECTYPFEDNAFVVGNEEAKLIGLEGNRRINGGIYAGILLIMADDLQGGTTDLTDEQVAHYLEAFKTPEAISRKETMDDVGFRFIAFKP